jgi:hypothetical protein
MIFQGGSRILPESISKRIGKSFRWVFQIRSWVPLVRNFHTTTSCPHTVVLDHPSEVAANTYVEAT